MPRAKLRTPELRRRVVDVAVSTLTEEGFDGFTTRKVAQQAGTSLPAVYELFGDKAGLVREVSAEGFRRLRDRLERLPSTDDARADLVAALEAYRGFARDNRVLAEVMFSRPIAELGLAEPDRQAGAAVRQFVLGRVRRAIDEGVVAGDPADVAHVLIALAQGLAAQENAGWLGTSRASANRRWRLAVETVLTGLTPT